MLGERLRKFRLARGMSVEDLEAAINEAVSRQPLAKYERGELQPTARVLNRIASVLGIKSAQLWGEPTCDTEVNPFLIRRWIHLLINHLVNVVDFCNYQRKRGTVS